MRFQNSIETMKARLQRWVRHLPAFETRNGRAIAALGLLGVLGAITSALSSSDHVGEKRIFVEREAYDFKNARVLGEPERLILDGEERQLAKTRTATQEIQASQQALRDEISALRADLSQLKASPQPESTPEGATTPTVVEPPSATQTEMAHAASDHIKTSQSAPQSFLPQFGLDVTPRNDRKGSQGKAVISFPVKSAAGAFRAPSVILPSGAYVKAKLLTGVEAPEGRSYPALLELDFAYVIPNQKRLDLAGCFIIAKAQGDLSTERVQMQAVKLSCVSRKGGFFEREVNGFVADDADNSFAVMGAVNSKQDRVAATAFLASIVQGIGKAIQAAQTTSQTTPLGGSQSVVTGDQAKYIAAGGASEAASQVTQWYLKQAENLLPTINIGSGQSVWVIMQDSVDLPKDYFSQSIGGNLNASVYSHFTRILE